MFLGLNGVCVKSHGGTDAVGFATAIGLAIDMVKYGGNQLIAEHISQIGLSRGNPEPPAAVVAS
jgi:glycerol-3-phosphate acyltransferase PlsX